MVYSWIRALDPATACDYAGQLFYLKNAEDFNAGKIKDAALVGVQRAGPVHRARGVEQSHGVFPRPVRVSDAGVVPRQTIEKYGDRWMHGPAAAGQRAL